MCYRNLVNTKEELLPKRRQLIWNNNAFIRQRSRAHQCQEQSLVVHRSIPMRWIIVFDNHSVNVPTITSVRTQPPTNMLIHDEIWKSKVQKQKQQNNILYIPLSLTDCNMYSILVPQVTPKSGVVTFHPSSEDPPRSFEFISLPHIYTCKPKGTNLVKKHLA